MDSRKSSTTRVLLVEDNPGDALLVEEALNEGPGNGFRLFHVETLKAGEDALLAAPFDIIVLDLSLPDARGLEALARIQLYSTNIPIVVLTGLDDEKIALRAVHEGAQDYLIKDGLFNTVLVRSLRYAIERAGAKSALEASEERFRLVSQATHDGIWEYDWSDDRLWWSDSFSQMFGYSGDEVLGHPGFWAERLHPEDRVEVVSRFADAVQAAGRSTWSDEYRFQRNDGTYAHVFDRGYIIRDSAGSPTRMVGAIIDITERKEAEQTNRERACQQEVVAKLGRVALQDGHVEVLMEEVVRSVAETLDVEYCKVLELLPGGDRLLLRTGVGWKEGLAGQATVGTDADSQAGYTLRSEAPVVVEDLRLETRFQGPSLLIEHGVVSGMSVIIGDIDRPWGVLGTHSTRNRPFSANDVHFLQTVADLLAQAIGRADAAEAIRRSEERFRALMENSLDIVTVIDADGVIRYKSPSIGSVLGWTHDELVGRSLYDLVHPADVAHARDTLADNAAAPQAKCALNVRIRHKDGRWRAVEALGQNLLDDAGVRGIVINSRDVTERKEAEEELRRSEERFSKAFRTAPLGITLTSLEEGVMMEVNEQFVEISGYAPDEMVGRTLADLGLWADSSEWAEATGRLQREGSLVGFTAQLRTKQGAVRIVELYSEKLDVDGRPSVLTLHQDVTDRKLLEEQLRQAQKMEAIGRLAGGVAHDFNNLITAIRGHAEFLLEELPEGGIASDDAEEIRKNADRAASLTRQLLAFSRQQVLRPQVIDAGEAVRGTEGLLRRLIGEDIDFDVSIAPDVGRIEADPGQLEQVLMNLCINSKDAMPQGGLLGIEVCAVENNGGTPHPESELPPGSYVLITVSDTGAGMGQETREHIFDPFFTTKGQGRGTGLGLSTVYGVVKQSGGHIYCYSEEGLGTTFKVFLPQVEAEVEVDSSRASGDQARAGTSQGDGTILLVEDETSVRKLARRALEREGYCVLEAEGAANALLQVLPDHDGPLDLLLTDVVMPEMGGRELAERVEALYPDIRTIFMSGYTEDEVVRRGIVKSESSFLEKPFTPKHLVRQIRDVLSVE